MAWEFVSGRTDLQMTQLGWKSVGLLELTALPSIETERWAPMVRDADVLLAAGGDALYLSQWMRECGLADMTRSLDHTVWVGLSAGSMVTVSSTSSPKGTGVVSTPRRPPKARRQHPAGGSRTHRRASHRWARCDCCDCETFGFAQKAARLRGRTQNELECEV
jgi:hypothetical protein